MITPFIRCFADIRPSIKRQLIAIALSLLISACGGGGGSSDSQPQTPQQVITGQAVLGPLCGADVALFSAGDLKNAIHTTTTDSTPDLTSGGTFALPADLLTDGDLYVVSVSGGVDIDADDDGIIDTAGPTMNNGTIHLVATGAVLKRDGFSVNILTEMAYSQVAYDLMTRASDSDIIAKLNRCARLLLAADLDGDAAVSYADLVFWHPIDHTGLLRQHNDYLTDMIAAVHDGENITSKAAGHLTGAIGAFSTSAANMADIENNYLFLADYETGLLSFDLENPESPGLADSIDSAGFYGLVVSGGYAYVTYQSSVADDSEPSGLVIIDISDPGNMSVSARLATLGTPYGVAVEGGYAYVTFNSGTSAGVQFIDIGNPESPESAGTYTDGLLFPLDIDVSDSYLYVADAGVGLLAVNISDLQNPVAASLESFGPVAAVTVDNRHAYISLSDTWPSGVVVIDISAPDTLSEDDMTGVVETPGLAWDLKVIDNRLYAACGSAGLQILDAADYSSPLLSGSFNTPGEAYGSAIYGDYAYVADGPAGLQIVDISESPLPSIATGIANTPGIAYQAAVSGDYAFVADDYAGIQVIDISNPETPAIIAEAVTDSYAFSVALSGNLACVAAADAGLQMVDISNPNAPAVYDAFDTVGSAYGVAMSGGYAYVADQAGGLQVINIANPETPEMVGSVDTEGDAWMVNLKGNYAYVAAYDAGLKVVNIELADDPIVVGTVALPGYVYDVALFGNYAFAAAGEAGLQVIDISTPENPQLLGNVALPGYLYAVTAYGSYLYAAGDMSGLHVLNINDAANPVWIATADVSGFPVWGITPSNGYLYLANDGGGVLIAPAVQ